MLHKVVIAYSNQLVKPTHSCATQFTMNPTNSGATQFKGPFKAVIFDWAGTMVDFGSLAPMHSFLQAFKGYGVEATQDEARLPMGSPKRNHIEQMMTMSSISKQWQLLYGRPPTQEDIEKVYRAFIPLNIKMAKERATLIPGALETFRYLQERGIKVGSTTGYSREIMEGVIERAAKQGYRPESVVCSDEVKEGRPSPLGIYKCLKDLEVELPSSVIKVDDTIPGIKEGRRAGCLTVGVTMSGNDVGLTETELALLGPDEHRRLHLKSAQKLKEGGAHYVIETVADLPKLMEIL